MDRDLHRRIVEIMYEDWEETEGTLHSETIYSQLLEKSREIPEDVMREILEGLQGL